jgi:ferredoxin-NADP reductase
VSSPTDRSAVLPVRISAIRQVAIDIKLYELAATDGGLMPAATPGSHIEVDLPVGKRQYSLVLDGSGERQRRYTIAVKNELDGRGGSRYMHGSLGVGDVLDASAPKNNFPMVETAPETVLIAGGIGITPIIGMVNRAQANGVPWRLHYAARSREHMAFLEELEGRPNVHLHLDSEAGGPLDVAAIVRTVPEGAHVYCCGPVPMLQAFEAATAGLSEAVKHVEYFHPKEAPALEGGFTVSLARSRMELVVPKGKTILEVVEAAGVEVEYSCTEGTCGSCQTKVLEGVPDHRDTFLPANRKNSNTVMMICCSGSRTDRLVLDI